jgi:hypothetical protein
LGGLEGLRDDSGVGNPGAVVPEVEQRVAALKDALKIWAKRLEIGDSSVAG